MSNKNFNAYTVAGGEIRFYFKELNKITDHTIKTEKMVEVIKFIADYFENKLTYGVPIYFEEGSERGVEFYDNKNIIGFIFEIEAGIPYGSVLNVLKELNNKLQITDKDLLEFMINHFDIIDIRFTEVNLIENFMHNCRFELEFSLDGYIQVLSEETSKLNNVDLYSAYNDHGVQLADLIDEKTPYYQIDGNFYKGTILKNIDHFIRSIQ